MGCSIYFLQGDVLGTDAEDLQAISYSGLTDNHIALLAPQSDQISKMYRYNTTTTDVHDGDAVVVPADNLSGTGAWLRVNSWIDSSNFIVLPTGVEMKGTFQGIIYSMNVSDASNDIDFSAGSFKDSMNSIPAKLDTALTKQMDAVWAEGNNAGLLLNGTVAADKTYLLYALIKSTGAVDFGAVVLGDSIDTYLPTGSGYTKYAWCGLVRTKAASAALVPWIFTGRYLYFNLSSEGILFSPVAPPANCNTAVDISTWIPDIIKTPRVLLSAKATSNAKQVVVGYDGTNVFTLLNAAINQITDTDLYARGYLYDHSKFMPLKTTSFYWGDGTDAASGNVQLHLHGLEINR